jgi:uncharacterized repeat protein (TIGR01451 family)
MASSRRRRLLHGLVSVAPIVVTMGAAVTLVAPAPAAAQPAACSVGTLADDESPNSLRTLIANGACSEITFDVTGTITLDPTLGELTIGRSVIITGPGADQLTIDAAGGSRVALILSGGQVSLSGLTITGGAADQGAGILNEPGSALTLTNTVLAGNIADDDGGGMFNAGTATVSNSTFAGNTASSNVGGGVVNLAGTLTVSSTTLTGNTAAVGGGIANGGTMTVTNATLTGNAADFDGGGILNVGTMTVTNATLTGNAADFDGGGIHNADGTLSVRNSIVASSAAGGDCAGDVVAEGTSFHTDGTCPGFTQVTSAALNLGPLADNGGPTQTHALGAGSVALDAVLDGECTLPDGTTPVATDQRGVARPQGPGCDVGAYEASPEIEVTPSAVDFQVVPVGGTGSATVAIGNGGDHPLAIEGLAVGGGPFVIDGGPTAPFAIEPGGSVEVPVVFSPTGPRPFAGTLTIGSDDSDEPTVTVALTGRAPGADLGLTMAVAPEQVTVGDRVTFSVAVTNAGLDAATGVRFANQLPTGLTFVSSTASQGVYDPVTGDWPVGDLAVDETATLTIEATVAAPGTFTYTATVTGTPDDPDPADSTASATVVATQPTPPTTPSPPPTPPGPGPARGGAATGEASEASLPLTGAEGLALARIGALLVAAGGVLLAARRCVTTG